MGGGRGMGIPIGVGGGGLGLLGLIAIVLLNALSGGGGGASIDPQIDPFPQAAPATGPPPGQSAADATLKEFVGFVVADVQKHWQQEFARGGKTYEPTKLVLFTDATSTGCGPASSSTGPFYCPVDRKVYLDLGFFAELRSRFGAPGDFAQAYVIAHEFGHHVQKLTGISDQVTSAQQRSPDESNDLSVRLELQADCFAGVWAHTAYAQGELESGDVDEGLAAAAAVGDDRLQREATGRIDRESWTHGSSEQRSKWFRKGFDSGDPNGCNTFSGSI
jgi:predicted metalloprotease